MDIRRFSTGFSGQENEPFERLLFFLYPIDQLIKTDVENRYQNLKQAQSDQDQAAAELALEQRNLDAASRKLENGSICDGEDEEEALKTLSEAIESGLGEL